MPKTNIIKLVSWVAVLFRLWVRFRVVRNPGWDDLLVTISSVRGKQATQNQLLIQPDHKHNSYHLCTNMYVHFPKHIESSLLTLTTAIEHGLGRHYLYLGRENMTNYIRVSPRICCIIVLTDISEAFLYRECHIHLTNSNNQNVASLSGIRPPLNGQSMY
jgi:hypothetical protein